MISLPTLYHKGKSGAIYQWTTWTDGPEIFSEYGQVGGEMQIASRRAEAKNVGRSNETTPEAQADLEAKADWKFKLDRKYVEKIEDVHRKKIDVMKAPNDKWDDPDEPKKSTKKYAVYPGDAQPKLDGNRCLAYWDGDDIKLLSRGGKFWNLPHIVEQLKKIMPQDAMFDGELYRHGVSRQTINSWTQKWYPELTPTIQFHVYDIPVADGEEKPWEERRHDQVRLVPVGADGVSGADETPNIIRVQTWEVNSEEEVAISAAKVLEFKYEGLMFRNRKGVYKWGHRSKNLLKVKPFQAAEFKIIGFEDGDGKDKGAVKWICETKDGKPFTVVPNGSYAERQQWFRDGESFIGHWLTVEFQNYSDDGIPQILRGIGTRLDEDMDKSAA